MDSADTKRLIDDLKLTKQEERFLRHLTGLGYPEPKGRLDRFFYGPLKGPGEVLLALLFILFIIAILAIVFYLAWKYLFLNEVFKAFGLLVLFSLISMQRRGERLIRKLYWALENARASAR